MFLKISLFITTALFLEACSNDGSDSTTATVNITLAAEMSLSPTTVWVAENQGFFKKHHVNLTIKEFDSGRNSLETMLRDDSINIATVAQTPVVFNSFNNEPYVIVATMAYSLDNIKVLARKDRGINTSQDLRGKKIGATKRSTGHYFLEGFLSHYGFSLSDIDLQDINTAELPQKLQSGAVDAITTWEPYIHNTEKIMGKENLSLLISPTNFRRDFYFTVKREYANSQSADIQQFLAALVDAEKFIKAKPEKSQQIVAARLNTDIDIIKRIWNTFIFEITLEQSILVNLEDEALWAMRLSKEPRQLPNYLDFININPLLKVKPHSVNVIH